MSIKTNAIDAYISEFPLQVREMLEQIRFTIKTAVPECEEVWSYKMPAYKYYGMLVYFAGYKNHIGFYPTASGILAFEKDLKDYEYSKGTIKFALDKPLPLDLIAKIARYRAKENIEKKKK